MNVTVCPKNCLCQNASAYCEMISLTEIPSINQLPNNVQLLDMSKNRLKRLSVSDLFAYLQKLTLSHNQIEEIETNAFAHYPNLTELDLSFNQIERLPDNLFAALSQLKVLRLQMNRLATLPDQIFHPLVRLEMLDLSDNPLHYAYDSWFKKSANLRQLDMSSCHLTELPHSLFYQAVRLEQLDLSDNRFETVPVLNSATNLKTLILDRNPWLQLNTHSFPNLLRLQELHINDCSNMSQIDEYTFTDLRSLRVLAISRNPHLIYIDPLAFQGLFNETHLGLRELIMHENTLTIIDERTLPFERLQRLDLRANPFNCDCGIAWARLLTNRFEQVRTAR